MPPGPVPKPGGPGWQPVCGRPLGANPRHDRRWSKHLQHRYARACICPPRCRPFQRRRAGRPARGGSPRPARRSDAPARAGNRCPRFGDVVPLSGCLAHGVGHAVPDGRGSVVSGDPRSEWRKQVPAHQRRPAACRIHRIRPRHDPHPRHRWGPCSLHAQVPGPGPPRPTPAHHARPGGCGLPAATGHQRCGAGLRRAGPPQMGVTQPVPIWGPAWRSRSSLRCPCRCTTLHHRRHSTGRCAAIAPRIDRTQHRRASTWPGKISPRTSVALFEYTS